MKLRYMLSLAVATIISANICLASSVSGKVTGAAAGTVVWIDDPSGKVEPPSKPEHYPIDSVTLDPRFGIFAVRLQEGFYPPYQTPAAK